MLDTPKQKLYKTAFSPAYNLFVAINEAEQVDGYWVYTCSSWYGEETLDHVKFREDALERFCL